MAKTAVVFRGRNGLDFSELRSGVMRIPDVTLRIREAQAILDSLGLESADLLGLVSSDDELFFRNIQLKASAAPSFKWVLFDRYLKTQKRPDLMVGNSNGDSAMMVCAGQMTFREMIESSQALSTLRSTGFGLVAEKPVEKVEKVVPLVAVQAMPMLSGLTLTEYKALEVKASTSGGQVEYETMKISSMELRKLVATLHEDHGIARFVNIGPASALRGSDYRMLGAGDVESVDSIELDPMLGWFWRQARPQPQFSRSDRMRNQLQSIRATPAQTPAAANVHSGWAKAAPRVAVR